MMNAEVLLAAFADAAGMRKLEFDERGVASFQIDRRILMSIEKSVDEKLLYIYAELLQLPDNPGEAFLRHLLHLNHDVTRTRHGALAVDAESGDVILRRSFFLVNATLEHFIQVMTDMVYCARDLEHDLASGQAPVSHIPGPEAGDRPMALTRRRGYIMA